MATRLHYDVFLSHRDDNFPRGLSTFDEVERVIYLHIKRRDQLASEQIISHKLLIANKTIQAQLY